MNVTQTRKKRIEELIEKTKHLPGDVDVIRAAVVAEAQKKYGVSPRTARDYAKTVLHKMGIMLDWYNAIETTESGDPGPTGEVDESEP